MKAECWKPALETELAAAGGESSDPTLVRIDASADLGPAGTDRMTCDECHGARLAKRGRNTGEVSKKCPSIRSLPA